MAIYDGDTSVTPLRDEIIKVTGNESYAFVSTSNTILITYATYRYRTVRGFKALFGVSKKHTRI